MSDWWDYPTNFTNRIDNTSGNSVDGVGSFFGSYPASIVPGMGLGLVAVLWLVFFSLSVASGVRKAMMVSSFICTILVTYLWRIGLVDVWVIFLLTVLTIVGAMGSKEENL